MLTKSEICEQLASGIYEIHFTRVNGDIRKMKATLLDSILPNSSLSENTGRKKNDSTVTVWDIEKDSWRSFKVDSLISIESSNV